MLSVRRQLTSTKQVSSSDTIEHCSQRRRVSDLGRPTLGEVADATSFASDKAKRRELPFVDGQGLHCNPLSVVLAPDREALNPRPGPAGDPALVQLRPKLALVHTLESASVPQTGLVLGAVYATAVSEHLEAVARQDADAAAVLSSGRDLYDLAAAHLAVGHPREVFRDSLSFS